MEQKVIKKWARQCNTVVPFKALGSKTSDKIIIFILLTLFTPNVQNNQRDCCLYHFIVTKWI